MFCGKCGKELSDDSAFCSQCGSPVPRIEARDNSQPQVISPPEARPAYQIQPQSQPQPKRKRTKVVAAIVVAALIVVAGVGGALWWKSDQDAKATAQAEWDRTHMTLVTRIMADAFGFDDDSTGIPVQVSGSDLDGNKVNEVQYLHPASMQANTLPGSYTLSFPAGYITGDGTVVKAPNTTIDIEVSTPAENGPSGDKPSSEEAVANPEQPVTYS